MSKLFKSKIFLGFIVFAAFAFVSTNSANAMITMTLKKGMRNSQVSELQTNLGVSPVTGYFGSITKAAVRAFQASKGITQTGVWGPISNAAWNAMGNTGGMTYPAGCTSSTGFSSTTGLPCSGSTTSGNTTTQTGPISAMLSSDTPMEGYILPNQATADLAHFTFSGTGTVNSVTLKRTGYSDQNTLSNVYLYDGVSRLTDGYSFNTNGEIVINNLNLAVAGSKTIAVKADVVSSPSGTTLGVNLASFSSGTTVNTVNLMGKQMTLGSNTSLGSLTASGSNSVSTGSVNAGTTAYTVWRQAYTVGTRALHLKAANFRVAGSAPADALANGKLYIDGVQAGGVATMAMLNGSNYMQFDMSASPVSLNTGSHTIEVRADVVKGSSYNFTVSLQQASDLMVMDPQVGINVAITTFTASNAGTINIGTGSYTVVMDPTFSTMTTVTAGASNATIAKFKIRGYGEDIKVTSLPVTTVLTSPTPAAAGLQNLTVYFNGAQVGTQLSQAIGLNTFSLGSQMIIPAGVDSMLEIKADLRTTGGTNYTAGNISANIGAATAEGWNSKASITGPTATGNILTMQAGTLGISKSVGYANQNVNPNSSAVKIGSFVLQNQSTSESVRVTSLAVNLAYGAGTSSSNLSGLRTSETSGNAGTPVQPTAAAASSNATNTFSTDFTLAPGAVKTIDILADSSSDNGATATVISTLTVTSLGVTSNISATSSAIVGQTVTFRVGTVATPTIVGSSSTTAQLVAAANGGNANGSLAVYNFTSANASSTISELTFTVTGALTATTVKVGSVTAPVVAGTAYLTGLNIVVPNGGSGVNVNVEVAYPEVGTSGLASATTSMLRLTTVKSTSGNTTTTLGSLTVDAPTMTLVGSKPTYTVIDSSDTLVNGLVKIAEVTVAADTKGDIKIGQLPITVSSTGVVAIATGSDNIVVKDASDATVTTRNATFAVAAGGSGTGIICFDTTTAACGGGQAVGNGYLIPAGTSKTFRIYVSASSVAGATGTTSLSTRLGAATSPFGSNTTYYDVAGGATSAQVATALYGYPTNTSVISN